AASSTVIRTGSAACDDRCPSSNRGCGCVTPSMLVGTALITEPPGTAPDSHRRKTVVEGCALSAPAHVADALVFGCADEGLAPTSTRRETCFASWPHTGYGATDRGPDSATVSTAGRDCASSPVSVQAARRCRCG